MPHLAGRLAVVVAVQLLAQPALSHEADEHTLRQDQQPWSISDRDFCSVGTAAKQTKQSLVASVYRAISRSVPHSDTFYPSCSRFIQEAMEHYSILGLIVGLGRFSRSHLPLIHPDYPAIVVAGGVRLYDPLFFDDHYGLRTSHSLRNSGFTSSPVFYTSCSESRRVQQRYQAADGGPDPAWRL